MNVFGPAGGPFTLVFDNQGLANDQTTNAPTTGGDVTAAISQPLPQVTTTIQQNERQRIRVTSTSGVSGIAGTLNLGYQVNAQATNNLSTSVTWDNSANFTNMAQSMQDALAAMLGVVSGTDIKVTAVDATNNTDLSASTPIAFSSGGIPNTIDFYIDFLGVLATATWATSSPAAAA